LPSMVKDEDVTQGNHPPANVPSPSKQPGGVRSEPNDDDDAHDAPCTAPSQNGLSQGRVVYL